jgi:hypothetical protein
MWLQPLQGKAEGWPAPGPDAILYLKSKGIRCVASDVLNILDRANVGFARLAMQDDLGLSKAAFDLGYGMFYLGYLLFEVPSNLLMHRFGARRWIARLRCSQRIYGRFIHCASCLGLLRLASFQESFSI